METALSPATAAADGGGAKFDDLPGDVKLRIMSLLPVRDLARLGSTTKEQFGLSQEALDRRLKRPHSAPSYVAGTGRHQRLFDRCRRDMELYAKAYHAYHRHVARDISRKDVQDVYSFILVKSWALAMHQQQYVEHVRYGWTNAVGWWDGLPLKDPPFSSVHAYRPRRGATPEEAMDRYLEYVRDAFRLAMKRDQRRARRDARLDRRGVDGYIPLYKLMSRDYSSSGQGLASL